MCDGTPCLNDRAPQRTMFRSVQWPPDSSCVLLLVISWQYCLTFSTYDVEFPTHTPTLLRRQHRVIWSIVKTLLFSENWRSLLSTLEVSATNVPYESTIYITLHLYRIRDMLRYWSRIANSSHPTCTWRPRWGYCRRNCVAPIQLRNLEWWT